MSAPFRLFDFLRELRNAVYEFVFAGQEIDVHNRRPLPHVLKVNRQMYAEARKIFFETAVVGFRNTTALCSWYDRLPEKLQSSIGCLRLRTMPFERREAVAAAKRLAKVRKNACLELNDRVFQLLIEIREEEYVWISDPVALAAKIEEEEEQGIIYTDMHVRAIMEPERL